MYTKEEFMNDCRELFTQCSGNQMEIPGASPIKLFGPPVIGFASAADQLFVKYKDKEVIGSMFLSPSEWLPGAKTVAAFFFPFSSTVRDSNRETSDQPSAPWLYGRIEGQHFLNGFMDRLRHHLADAGIGVCVPSMDGRFKIQRELLAGKDGDDFHADSRWSERHAAYACGLGTFGLSRGLITKRGMAGRIASIVIDAGFEPDERPYTGIYDFCIRCGACVVKCPAEAISMEYGKNNVRCSSYLDKTKALYSPRYGCGKCQVGVPCESRIPAMGT